MTADLFDRYIWLSIILAKFNLQYHLCSPFLWKMGSFQYVGPGYKACLSKLSQSFFIIFPPMSFPTGLVLHLLVSAISLPWWSFAFTPMILGLNPTLLKKSVFLIEVRTGRYETQDISSFWRGGATAVHVKHSIRASRTAALLQVWEKAPPMKPFLQL